MQPKFKKGDKIRCTSKSTSIGIYVGGIYTVSNPMYCDWGDDISIEVEGLDEVSPFQSRFELVEETNKPKFNGGDMVETPLGLFEVLDSDENSFLCYKEGYVGHSGNGYFGNKYLLTKYEDQCWWFDEIELELVKTNEQPKINYREMSPDTLVKVSIDGNEFEVPLKDMLRVLSKSSTVMDKGKVTEFYIKLNNILTNGCGLSFSNKDGSIRYVKDCGVNEDFFEPYFSKQKEKEALKKDIETQKYILETQQALLKDLEVKYNSL